MKTEQDRREDPNYRKLVSLPCGAKSGEGKRQTATLSVFSSSSTAHRRRYVSFATKDTLVRINHEDAVLLVDALIHFFDEVDADD